MKNDRVFALDLVRFIAALCVALYHYTWFGASAVEQANFGIFSNFFSYGKLAVQLFFMISGFVIAWSVYNKSASDFFYSRVLRLYPTYWICLILTCLILFFYRSPDIFEVIANLTMFQQFFGVPHIDGSYWTLTNEIIFYSYMFLIIKFRLTSRLVEIFTIHTLLCMLYWLYRIYMNQEPPVVGTLFLLEYGHLFIAGHILYRLFFLKLKNNTMFCSIILILTFILANVEVFYSSDGLARSIVSCFIVSLFFVLFVYIKKIDSLCFYNKFMLKITSILGSISYPFYLLHQEIGYEVFNATSSWLSLLTCFSVVIVIAYLVSAFLDSLVRKKIISLGLFFKSRLIT